MNYELAKKLKDAGFPKTERPLYFDEGYLCGLSQEEHDETCTDYDCKVASVEFPNPTLSELIEACGARFYELTYLGEGDIWQAKGLKQQNDLWQMYRGSTPEEAVANLWLALNTR